MIGEMNRWSYGLLFALLVIVLGMTGLVSSARSSDRSRSRGLFLQGILLIWVIGAAFHLHPIHQYSGDLKIGGLLLVGLLIVQSLWQPDSTGADPASEDIATDGESSF
jgi:hypothetical protein